MSRKSKYKNPNPNIEPDDRLIKIIETGTKNI